MIFGRLVNAFAILTQHQNNRHYISLACGCTIYHTIDSVWSEGKFIEDAEIINSSVENYEQENIHLRLKTAK